MEHLNPGKTAMQVDSKGFLSEYPFLPVAFNSMDKNGKRIETIQIFILMT